MNKSFEFYDEACISDDSDDEGEDDAECPTIRVSKSTVLQARSRWRRALIFRTLGKTFPYGFMTRKIQQLWAKQGGISVWDIGFGHYVAKFMDTEDYERALFEGPWLIGDHYIVAEEWRPNFEPGYSVVNKIRAWVRLPSLPVEYFDPDILTMIGDKIGKTIRLDNTTMSGTRGNFARICVEIDLDKPLLSKYRLRRRVRRVEYEGLHLICFHCGCYGHGKEVCPVLHHKSGEAVVADDVTVSTNPMFQSSEGELPRPELEEEFGPWMLAKKKPKRHPQRSNLHQAPPAQSNAEKSKPANKTHPSVPTGSRFSSLAMEDEQHGEAVKIPEVVTIPLDSAVDSPNSPSVEASIKPNSEAQNGGSGASLVHGNVRILQRDSPPRSSKDSTSTNHTSGIVVPDLPKSSEFSVNKEVVDHGGGVRPNGKPISKSSGSDKKSKGSSIKIGTQKSGPR
ncbi:hypothetical protein LINPERHAP2_LOCUS35156 [Linum perenne]